MSKASTGKASDSYSRTMTATPCWMLVWETKCVTDQNSLCKTICSLWQSHHNWDSM